jgi:nicotinamidase-related amidase
VQVRASGVDPTRLCDRRHSRLLLIDLQERLLAAMPEDERAAVERNTGRLVEAARLLDVPVEATLQYPRGLGSITAPLDTLLGAGDGRTEKTAFSCCAADDLVGRLTGADVIVCGTETHVCVLQTTLELLAAGETVFVVADAVCSRDPRLKANGIERMRAAGAVITNHESVLFEWLRDAADPQFPAVSRLILRR